MNQKSLIRKKFFLLRKRNYFQIDEKFFNPIISLIKKQKKKVSNISLYYPCYYEVDVLKILNLGFFKKTNFLLPKIKKNNSLDFFKWKKNDTLYLSKFGIPEPINSIKITPDIILLPLLAFDKKKNRIGYGKGFYDKFLLKFLNKNKRIMTVGVAFSFQKHHKLPINKRDYRLDYIITEKGIF